MNYTQNNQQIIESNNWAAVSQGTTSSMRVVNGKQERVSEPTNMGIFAIATNLAYLARQIPTLNKHAKRQLKQDGSFYLNLGSITVKPDGQNSVGRKRLARYGFNLDMMPNVTKVVVASDIPEYTRKRIEKAYTQMYKKGMSGAEFLEVLKRVPVLATGNYAAANNALNPMIQRQPNENKLAMLERAQYATIFLKYVDLDIALNNKGLFPKTKPFQFGPLPTQSETKLGTANLGLKNAKENNKVVKMMRMSATGNSDGTIYGMNTLNYFKNFNSYKNGILNLRNYKTTTQDVNGNNVEVSFSSVVLGTLDWAKMNDYQKIQFPDNIIQLFNAYQVQRISFRYTFSVSDYVNGMPRQGSFLDKIQKFNFKAQNNGLWGFNGAICLDNTINDFDPQTLENKAKKHITLYKSKSGQINADIVVQRPTFIQVQKTVSDKLIRQNKSNYSDESFDNLIKQSHGYNNGIELAPTDLQAGM